MVGQHGVNLAVNIITSHFGDLVAKVCTCLLRRGSLSLPELLRFTELSASQIKNCLLVLIQHNCVQAFSVPRVAGFGAATRAVTLYTGLFDNILHRVRFSKFLAIVTDDPELSQDPNLTCNTGSQKPKPVTLNCASQKPKSLNPNNTSQSPRSHCGSLLEGLLQHGRLTFEQLVVRETANPGNTVTRGALRVDFNRLVHARYVERCPKAEPFLLLTTDGKPSTRKRGAKSAEQKPTIEQQAITAAALLDAERFSIITDGAAHTTQGAKATDDYLEVSAGDKRKYEAIEMDPEDRAAITENEVLWRPNVEKFVHCLTKKVCVANVKSSLGSDAGIVLEALIETSPEEKVKDKSFVTSSIDNILARARMKKGDSSMTLEDIRIILEQLGCRLCTEENGALYSIDLKAMIESCRNGEVEALVLKRYGKDAYRIFRLLAKDGQPFETDRVSDITILGKKEAKAILYKLWKDDYLIMEKATSHGTGQMSHFFWKVNKSALWQHILNDMHHAILNMSQRSAHIYAQQHEISMDAEKLEKLRRSLFILQSSLLKLDDALMLFSDFR